jgi:peptide/nickel transport system substrate-binding protein
MLIAAVSLAAIAALTACSSGNSSSPASAQGNSSSASSTATFNFGIVDGPVNSLDPQKCTATYGAIWYGPAYESLITQTRDGNLHPGLATKWSFSSNGLTLDLTLRSGVTFSDGTPFNAAAVKADVNRGQTVTGSFVKPELSDITSVTVTSPTEVVLHLKTPSAVLLDDLAGPAGDAISPAGFAGGKLDTAPDGTGPFILDSYTVGQVADYSRNPRYWGKPAGVAHLDLTLYGNESSGDNAISTGQIDAYQAMDNQSIKTMQAAGLTINSEPGYDFEWLELNWGGKFANPLVREALAYASDRAQLNDFAGYGTPAYQWVLPSNPAYDESAGDIYSYDIAKAKQLLTQAGYPNGFSFTLWHTERTYTDQSAELMQAVWAKAGFHVTIRTTDAATVISNCFVQHICDSISGIAALTPDITEWAENMLPAGAPRNLSTVAMPGMDALINQANIPGPNRADAVSQLQSAMSKAVPALILRSVPVVYGLGSKVSGFQLGTGEVPFWADLKVS